MISFPGYPLPEQGDIDLYKLYMSSVTSHQACIEIHPPALYKAEHSSEKYSRFTQEITGERPYCGEEGFKIQNQNNYTSFIDVCIVDPSVFR